MADADRDGQAAETDREPPLVGPPPPNSITMPAIRTMPPRNSHWSWVRSTSRARRIRRNRDSTPSGIPTRNSRAEPTRVPYSGQRASSMPSGFVTCGARSAFTSETIRLRVVRMATTSTATTTRRHGDDNGRPSGNSCGITGSVKKYGGANPQIATHAATTPSQPCPSECAAYNAASW